MAVSASTFVSDMEEIVRYYRIGDLRLPLYSLGRELDTFEDVSIRRVGEKEFVELNTHRYEIRDGMLIVKVALSIGDMVKWTFYAKEL